MANATWIITVDHIGKGADVGVMGPRGCVHTADEVRAKGVMFRMFDDDGELYYEGRILGEHDGFEPLDDYGSPNAGCTTIKYRGANGEWETL